MEPLKLFRPVSDEFKISSPFGGTRTLTRLDGSTVTRVHHGIDFACPIGTPVYAFYDGDIFITGWENPDHHEKGLGYRIWQKFKYQDKWLYGWLGHLSKIMVDPGDFVKAGQKIALSGLNGEATGPHLHTQFREMNTGEWLNAEFTPQQGEIKS